MFPMTAKTIMTEEAYRRFAWTNFWYKKKWNLLTDSP